MAGFDVRLPLVKISDGCSSVILMAVQERYGEGIAPRADLSYRGHLETSRNIHGQGRRAERLPSTLPHSCCLESNEPTPSVSRAKVEKSNPGHIIRRLMGVV